MEMLQGAEPQGVEPQGAEPVYVNIYVYVIFSPLHLKNVINLSSNIQQCVRIT